MEEYTQLVKQCQTYLTTFTSKEGKTFNKLEFRIDGATIGTIFIDTNGALKLLLKNMGYKLYEDTPIK